jgi:hypothetical protein
MSRVSGLIGVAFAVTYAAGLFLDNGPSQDLSNTKTAAWYATDGMNQWLLSFALVALAGVCAICSPSSSGTGSLRPTTAPPPRG